jgi:antitoxin MazE6
MTLSQALFTLVCADHQESSASANGYTIGMKTAVSLPDDVYHGAERYAKRARKSRSQLYAEALAEYLARHAPDEVTEDMNAVIEQIHGSRSDSFVERAARQVLEDTEW